MKLQTDINTNIIQSKKRNRGFSLIETMIAVGVMSIVMMGFTQMMMNQQKETRALEEKLARLDVEKTLTAYMADSSICGPRY